MAFLAVSAPFNSCVSRGNPNDVKQEFFSKLTFQQPWKKASTIQHRQDKERETSVLAISGSSSFSNNLARLQSAASAGAAGIGPREVYQPFRPPPEKNSALENLSIEEQLQILRERRGLWFDYAIYVPSLIRAGFTPSMIDEATGMTGVEQNKIVVASQVRSSLQDSGLEPELLAFYDVGGADYLYELRILSAQQRKAAAEFAIERKMDQKEYRDLARAIKDYVRRKNEEGWNCFTPSPGDCLAFSCYRLSKEVKDDEEKQSFLVKGLEYATTEKAKEKLQFSIRKDEADTEDETKASLRLQVVRLTSSEAGSPTIPYVLPVVEPNVQDFQASPMVSRKGPFTIQYADAGWKAWVALPAWQPLTTSAQPVAVSYPNSTTLPWKAKSRKEEEEPIIVVADKYAGDVDPDTYYIVEVQDGNLGLQLGTVVSETSSQVLGKVVLALRPPSQEKDVLDDIEWD